MKRAERYLCLEYIHYLFFRWWWGYIHSIIKPICNAREYCILKVISCLHLAFSEQETLIKSQQRNENYAKKITSRWKPFFFFESTYFFQVNGNMVEWSQNKRLKTKWISYSEFIRRIFVIFIDIFLRPICNSGTNGP